MTEDTAQKMLRDARDEALRTGTHVTVFGHSLTVLVVPGVPGTMPGALYYVRGRAATLSDAAAAIAEPAIDATL